jgi:UDP-glucose:glycoprotein glucosyltransferase
MWVIGDLDSPDGFRIVKDALKHLLSEKCATRLGFIHVPSAEIVLGGPEMSTTLHLFNSLSALSNFHPADLLKLVERLEENPTGTGPDSTGTSEAQVPTDMMQEAGIEAIASPGSHQDLEVSYMSYADAGTGIARQLGINGSAPHLLVNGRVSHQKSLELIGSS